MSETHCATCKTVFDHVLHENLGGDCLLCMAQFGDPDAIETAFNRLFAQHQSRTKDQFIADQVAEHMQAQQTSMVRATVAAVMEVVGLTKITISMDRQATIWDRVEMFTDRNDEQTHVTFTLTPR